MPGTVLRLTAHVEPGNSGGPVLDRRGQIAGIVYARERGTGFALAIPVDTFRRLARIGGYEDARVRKRVERERPSRRLREQAEEHEPRDHESDTGLDPRGPLVQKDDAGGDRDECVKD